jgi:hypothetical protein
MRTVTEIYYKLTLVHLYRLHYFACQMQPQVPKVKIGEKITALQQIVSPFGKVYLIPSYG